MAAISSGTASVPESGSGWPAPLDRTLKKDLAGLDDRALLSIVRLLPQASERRAAACELQVTRHQGLDWFCGRPYLQMHVKCPAHPHARLLRSRLLELEGTRAHAGPALAPPAASGPCVCDQR